MEYSELYGEITPITGSVPRPTIIRNVRNTVITFCKEARAYTHKLTAQAHTDYTLTLTPPTDTRIWGASYVELTNAHKYDDARVNFFFDEGDQVFQLSHDIRTTDLLDLELVLIPTRTATQCDDKVMEPFFDVIVAGAIHGVLTMPNETWFNPALAQQYGMAFALGIDNARHRKRNDDNPGPRTCSYGGY